jgi:hypothetical protein
LPIRDKQVDDNSTPSERRLTLLYERDVPLPLVSEIQTCAEFSEPASDSDDRVAADIGKESKGLQGKLSQLTDLHRSSPLRREFGLN